MVAAVLRRFDTLSPLGSRLRGSRLWLLGAALAGVMLIAAASISGAALLDRVGREESGTVGRDSVATMPGMAAGAANEASVPYGPSTEAAPDAKGAGGTSTDLPLPTQATGRTLIRSGSVELTVRSVTDTFEQVRQLATQSGGFVADSTFTTVPKEMTSEPKSPTHTAAYLTLRIPAERFNEVVSQLRGMAIEVQTVSTSSQDVTDQISDLEATLRNLRAVESQYVTLLGRASNVGEVIQVQERLNQVRLQIDRTEARRTLLASQAELSTLSVTLRAEVAGANNSNGPLGAAQDAWDASLRSIEQVATAALVAVVYSWWLVIPAAVVLFVLRRRMRREPAAAV